jgi:hypothetical protein
MTDSIAETCNKPWQSYLFKMKLVNNFNIYDSATRSMKMHIYKSVTWAQNVVPNSNAPIGNTLVTFLVWKRRTQTGIVRAVTPETVHWTWR